MNIRQFFFLCFLPLFFSCENLTKKDALKKGEYLIKGQILNATERSLYLQRMKNNSWVSVDSTILDKNGSFSFSGKTDEPDFYLMRLGLGQPILLVVENDKEVEMTMDAQRPVESIEIKGSKPTTEYYEFTKKMEGFDALAQPYRSKIKEQKLDKDSVCIIQNMLGDLEDRKETFVKNYIDSIIPSLAVFNMLNHLNPENNLDFLKKLSDQVKEKMPGNKYAKMYTDEISQMLSFKEETDKKEIDSPVGIGKKAPDFELKDPSGKSIRLSSLRGKYVLIDFWASWCGPCRAENPHVVCLYRKYKDSGNFEIFGVSLDKEKTAWLSAIEKDGLSWHQVSDLKFWDSMVVSLYHIEGIPSTFLIDKEGVIIAKNLRGKSLDKKLQELLQ